MRTDVEALIEAVLGGGVAVGEVVVNILVHGSVETPQSLIDIIPTQGGHGRHTVTSVHPTQKVFRKAFVW